MQKKPYVIGAGDTPDYDWDLHRKEEEWFEKKYGPTLYTADYTKEEWDKKM